MLRVWPGSARVRGRYDGQGLAAQLRATARDTGRLLTVEDHWPEGGLGDAVLDGVRAGRRAKGIADQRVWVVTASFAGSTGGGFANGAGRSRIWNPAGEVEAEAGTEPGEIARATLP